MKIAIITSYSFVDSNASTERLKAYCNVLDTKHDVTTLAPDSKSILGISNISVDYQPDISSFFNRSITEIRYLLKCLRIIRNHEFDYLVSSCPSLFLMLMPLFTRKRVILDVRDLSWEYLPEGIFSTLVRGVFRFLCTLSAKSAHRIIVTNEEQFRYFNQLHHSLESKVTIISNGISKRRYDIVSKVAALSFGQASDAVSILFCGNVSAGRGLEGLIAAVGNSDKFIVNIVGDGTFLPELKRIVLNAGYKNIRFWGALDWSEVVDHYKKNHILYANLSDNFVSAMPSKLYEYLSLEHPVLFGGTGGAKDFLRRFSATYTIDPDDPSQINSALRQIVTDASKRSDTDKQYIENEFMRENQARKIEEFLT